MQSRLTKCSVPLDLVFSQTNIVERGHPHYEDLAVWQDVPITNLEPYFTALGALRDGVGTLDTYLDFERKRRYPQKIEPADAEKDLQRRISRVRRLFHPELPIIERLERDRLILREGNLQCCVAKLEQRRWINVLMPDDVISQWRARATEDLDREVAKQKRRDFYTPIMHEKYRKWRVSRPGTTRLDLMRRFLGPVHKKLTVLDIGCNTGFYTFHLFRQGFDTTGIDVNEKHLDIAKAQRRIYGIDIPLELCALDQFVSDRRFDIVLGLSVFWHILGWGKMPPAITPEQLGDKLESLVGHALFWESGRRADEEIDIIRSRSGLAHYTRLGSTSATGIEDREFGVFTRTSPSQVQGYFRA